MSVETVLITGGSGKLGTVMVRHFLSMGWTVVATGRHASSLDVLGDSCDGLPGTLRCCRYDFGEPSDVLGLVEWLHAKNLRPKHLVNNARNLDFIKVEADGRVLRENFLGEYLIDVVVPYELTMELASRRDSALRRVVNIGSQYGMVAANPRFYDKSSHQSPIQYGVAKAVLAHLTKELAVRHADRVVQVNCVAYGGVAGRVDDAFVQRYRRLAPMGRMLSEDDIGGPVSFLLSDAASGMTGHTMSVDGGWTIW